MLVDQEPQTRPTAARRPVRLFGRLVTGVLVAATTGLGLLIAVRVAGLDWFTPLAQLVAFTPYLGPVAVAVLLLAALLHRRRTAVVAALIVVVMVVLLLPRLVGGDAPAPSGAVPLRVMTINMWYGNATEAVMRLVRKERPDLLSLQEVTPQALDRLESAGLTDLLPYHAKRPQPGVAGTALYGRAPVTDGRTLDPRSRFDMARASYVHKGVTLDVVAVHPAPPVPGDATVDWREELSWLPEASHEDETVTVLAGDFNATLDHSGLRDLIDSGYVDAADAVGMGLHPTWQAGRVPPVTLDHILVEVTVGVRAVRIHPVGPSDHRAVVADLLIPPQ